MSEERLSRIEDKIDQMANAIVTLARMEERMITLFKRIDKYEDTQSKLSDRISAVEKVTLQRGVIYHFSGKVFWVVVGAVAAVIVKMQGSQ